MSGKGKEEKEDQNGLFVGAFELRGRDERRRDLRSRDRHQCSISTRRLRLVPVSCRGRDNLLIWLIARRPQESKDDFALKEGPGMVLVKREWLCERQDPGCYPISAGSSFPEGIPEARCGRVPRWMLLIGRYQGVDQQTM